MAPANSRYTGPPGATGMHCSLSEASATISIWGHSIQPTLGGGRSSPLQSWPMAHRGKDLLPGNLPCAHREKNCYLKSWGRQTMSAMHRPEQRAGTHGFYVRTNAELKGLVSTVFALNAPRAEGGPGDKVCTDSRQNQACHPLAVHAGQALRLSQGANTPV